jgi:hypothetical protein
MAVPSARYCPACFARVAAGAAGCPAGHAAEGALGYAAIQEALVGALADASATRRASAVAGCARLGDARVVDALVELALGPLAGVAEALDIVRVVDQLTSGTNVTAPLRRLAAEHRDPAVQLAALQALCRRR